MTKQKELRKKTIRTAVVSSLVVGATAGAYALLLLVGGNVGEDKQSIESRFNTENGLLSSLREQMDKSGTAEKRYAIIQEKRTALDYHTDIKVLKELLANAKAQYKFDDLRIKPVTAVISDKPELANFNYDIQVLNRFRITFKAVSDVHVFSFLEYFRNAVPGFIRIDMFEINRLSDLTEPSLNAIKNSGTMPLSVEAKIEFTWIGLALKDKKKTSNPPTP